MLRFLGRFLCHRGLHREGWTCEVHGGAEVPGDVWVRCLRPGCPHARLVPSGSP